MTLETVVTRFTSRSPDADEWRVAAMTLHEALDEPYHAVIDLECDIDGADGGALLGHDATLEIVRGTFTRTLRGVVERVEQGSTTRFGEPQRARAHVVPALVAARRIEDTRVFQDKSVPEILEEVLSEVLGVYDRTVEIALDASYPTRELCLQYRETTFDFVHRLMEEEGIAYSFTHDGEREVMRLTDRNGAFAPVTTAVAGALPFTSRGDAPREAVVTFRLAYQQRPTSTAVRAFDWVAPSAPVEAALPEEAPSPPLREIYDHGRDLRVVEQSGTDHGPTDEDRQATLARTASARDALVASGTSTVTGAESGQTFELTAHPEPSANREYLIVRVTHRLGEADYENSFDCVPLDVPWIPERRRPRPRIRGIQTARVVGPNNEEIHPDSHGRVRVQFHWDRQGENDDRSLCWLRLSESWAGPGWGFAYLPRIGMEVVVSFLSGDPDQPVITGCVYNGQNHPPYALPGEKTKSTIKSQSSPGGRGFNELRFEDAAGAEEIFVHAQKDLREEVLNDHDVHVGSNQSNTVGANQTQTIHGNQDEHVVGTQKLTVDGARTVHVKGSFTETIDSGETRTVSSGMTETISGSQTRVVNGGRTMTVNGGETRTVNGGLTETINGGRTHTYNTSTTNNVSGARAVTVTGDISLRTDATYERVSGGGSTITTAAGHDVLAPGGQRGVDKDISIIGGVFDISYSDQITFTANVQQTFLLRSALRGLDKRATGLKVDVIHTKISNKPVDLSNKGAGIVTGIILLSTAGFASLG